MTDEEYRRQALICSKRGHSDEKWNIFGICSLCPQLEPYEKRIEELENFLQDQQLRYSHLWANHEFLKLKVKEIFYHQYHCVKCGDCDDLQAVVEARGDFGGS